MSAGILAKVPRSWILLAAIGLIALTCAARWWPWHRWSA